jgi:hypothetical protein
MTGRADATVESYVRQIRKFVSTTFPGRWQRGEAGPLRQDDPDRSLVDG